MRNLVLVVFATGCLAPVAPTVVSPAVQIYESHDGSTTEGETTLAIDPDLAYAAATDYTRWSTIFPDIAQVIVTKQAGVDALVTLIHTNGQRDNIHFHNRPSGRVLWFEDTGGAAEVWAEIAFIPGPRAGTTRVHSRLFADVHGVASLFVSDARVRALRQQRVADNLGDLHTYFARTARR